MVRYHHIVAHTKASAAPSSEKSHISGATAARRPPVALVVVTLL